MDRDSKRCPVSKDSPLDLGGVSNSDGRMCRLMTAERQSSAVCFWDLPCRQGYYGARRGNFSACSPEDNSWLPFRRSITPVSSPLPRGKDSTSIMNTSRHCLVLQISLLAGMTHTNGFMRPFSRPEAVTVSFSPQVFLFLSRYCY